MADYTASFSPFLVSFECYYIFRGVWLKLFEIEYVAQKKINLEKSTACQREYIFREEILCLAYVNLGVMNRESCV